MSILKRSTGDGGGAAQRLAPAGPQGGCDEVLQRVADCVGLRAEGSRLAALGPVLQARARALSLRSLPDYAARLEQDVALRRREMPALARSLTTGETFFFRDAGQMGLLRQTVLPDLRARATLAGRSTLRVWSCACSTGEEPYSLALLMQTLWPDASTGAFEVVATDIDAQALARARAGVYGAWSFRGCDEALRSRWFRPEGEAWRLDAQILRAVRFDTLDLLHEPLPDPDRGLTGFDLIVCRNLFIYLTPQAVSEAAAALSRCLVDGGVLMTGHGELLHHQPSDLVVELHEPSMLFRRERGMPGSASTSSPWPKAGVADRSLGGAAVPSGKTGAVPAARGQAAAARPSARARDIGLARRALRKPVTRG